MNFQLKHSTITFLTLAFLILYSSFQFLLILRHKSPYLSDSYFYKHMYYQHQGSIFKDAYQKVKSQQIYTSLDNISLKIFFNEKAYRNSYSFFTKRPMYPYIAFVLNKIFNNEYLSFTLPVFLSYIGVIIMTFIFFKKGLNLFFATLGTFVFVSFYPFLDWSTYFLTDTIGAFFWMIQLFLIYKYLTEARTKWLYYFAISLIISLLNREQSLLIIISLLISQTLFFKYQKNNLLSRNIKIILISTLITASYVISAFVLHQKNILDTIIITMNNYGYDNNTFTTQEIIKYLVTNYKSAHVFLIKDLISHHLWFTFCLFSIIGLILSLKTKRNIDILIACSALASYFAIFLYPVLSYRYFFPVVIAISYFSAIFLSKLFSTIAKLEQSRNAK